MSLIEKIDADIIEAMKAKNELVVSVLRMFKSSLTNYRIATKKELTDEDVATVLQKEVKTRKESAEVYKKGNRPELATKEEKEVEILSGYLPEQASEEKIRTKAKEIIAATDASSIADMGKVMGQLMSEFKGKADGTLVSSIVKEELS